MAWPLPHQPFARVWERWHAHAHTHRTLCTCWATCWNKVLHNYMWCSSQLDTCEWMWPRQSDISLLLCRLKNVSVSFYGVSCPRVFRWQHPGVCCQGHLPRREAHCWHKLCFFYLNGLRARFTTTWRRKSRCQGHIKCHAAYWLGRGVGDGGAQTQDIFIWLGVCSAGLRQATFSVLKIENGTMDSELWVGEVSHKQMALSM